MRNLALQYLNHANANPTIPLTDIPEEEAPAENPFCPDFISYDKMLDIVCLLYTSITVTVGIVDLHFLQTLVVVLPGRNCGGTARTVIHIERHAVTAVSYTHLPYGNG